MLALATLLSCHSHLHFTSRRPASANHWLLTLPQHRFSTRSSLMVQLPLYRFHPHPSAIRSDHAATRLPCQFIPIRGHCITVTDPAPDSFRSAIVSSASHPFSLWYRPSTDLLAAAPFLASPPRPVPRLPPTARSGHSSARRRFSQGVLCSTGIWLHFDRG